MIDRQQLAEALGRMDPRDREILDYSLRRRVSDEDLGEILGGAPGDVARQRAAAVETLSKDLGVEGGSDLGHMLKQLLEPETWEMVPRTPEAPEPDTESGADRPPVRGERGEQSDGPRGAGTGRRAVLGLAVAVVLLVPAGVVAALSGPGPASTGGTDSDSGTRRFSAEPEGSGDPFPSDPRSAFQYPVAYLKGSTVLYAKPGGKTKVRIGAKTEWDSPRVLSIVKREGSWLAVLAPELENGERGWIRESDVKRLETVSWSLKVDLSKRRLVVRRNGKEVRSAKVGVGRTDHPTPVGRYAVTDKLRVDDESSPYGCCVLALTGHQTRLPEGWPGGDRLAVHATQDTSGLGQAVSLGCMRADPKDAAWMLKKVPLGTPVFVRG